MNVDETKVQEENFQTPEEAPVSESETQLTAESGESKTTDKAQLLDAMRKIIEENNVHAHKEVASIKSSFYVLRNKEITAELMAFVDEGNDPTTFSASIDPTETELKELMQLFRERRNAFLEEDERLRKANLEAKKDILAKLQEITSDIDTVNTRYSDFQQLMQQFKEKTDLPQGSENELWKNYQSVVELFYDHLKMNKELRDLDYKRNLESKQALVVRAKELETAEDIIEATRLLQGLHAEWREIGPVPKEVREAIWDAFKASSSVINKRHADYFEARHNAEKQNEEIKTQLCKEVEAINAEKRDSFKEWDDATKRVLEIQARWKETGFASRKVNTQLFNNFRAECDKFFKEKGEYYTRAKAEINDNYAKKLELCERAEALINEENMAKAAELAIAMQAEWKTIGGVGKKHSEEIWQRFTTACNAVFNRRKEFQNVRRKEESENLAAKREVIAALKEISLDDDKRSIIERVKELQSKWNEIGHVPFKMKDQLRKEYREICDKIFNSFDAKKSREQLDRFRNHLDRMKNSDNRPGRERDRIVRMIDQKKAELKTIDNNLGFFNIKSAAGNSMLRDIESRQAQIKEEIALLKTKLQEIDSKKENKED
ncbi:MAG: DUF349 domain-containing protein [Bacteroidales bacterium]|nr:DUF349 domain-containing protein [Bacteroidales bacterium]